MSLWEVEKSKTGQNPALSTDTQDNLSSLNPTTENLPAPITKTLPAGEPPAHTNRAVVDVHDLNYTELHSPFLCGTCGKEYRRQGDLR